LKLLSLTNRYYIFFIFLIVILGGFATFIILRSSINSQFNKKLIAEKEQLIFELHSYEDLKEAYYLNIGDKITLESISMSEAVPLTWMDTLLYDEYQKSEMAFRQIIFSEIVDGNNYLITISKSLLSTDELITNIEEIMLVMMFTIVVSLILITNRISKKVWQSFYNSLQFLRHYDIKKPRKPQFSKTKIEEFKQFNEVISLMIEKSINDYEALKEFSDNASHEIQTPLAIIKAKSELLMQDESLTEEVMNGISIIYTAANRLSNLNHDLTNLTKIDNNEFPEVKSIPLKEFLNEKLAQFEDLIRLKGIKVIEEFNAEPELVMNESLCHMMISNLLNNSIRHNVENGNIKIHLSTNKMEIENTGNPIHQEPSLLFQRFKKNSELKDSSGLGLSLVKKICDVYEFDISYTVHTNVHTISIVFNNI